MTNAPTSDGKYTVNDVEPYALPPPHLPPKKAIWDGPLGLKDHVHVPCTYVALYDLQLYVYITVVAI